MTAEVRHGNHAHLCRQLDENQRVGEAWKENTPDREIVRRVQEQWKRLGMGADKRQDAFDFVEKLRVQAGPARPVPRGRFSDLDDRLLREAALLHLVGRFR